MAFDNNKHLQEVLDTHKMKHIQSFVDKVSKKREEIKDKMAEHYGEKKYNSMNSGSMAKHTATNIKFDMDVIEPFKHSSFDTLQGMFDDVFDFLNDEYKDNATVRKQKVSIGLEFPKEEGDESPIQVDVVPGRELSDEDYNKTHDLNLCFNEDHWGFKKGTSQKTNIKKQIDHISGKKSERQVIRLLKIWKKHKEKKYKSFMLELFTIKALDGYNGDNHLWDRLKYTMEYIRDHVEDKSFHLYDPGNGNNDVLSSMSDIDRSSLHSDMDSMLINIENDNETFLPYYFPVNEKYKEKDDDGYEKKENPNGGASYPRKVQRFGI